MNQDLAEKEKLTNQLVIKITLAQKAIALVF